jgi:hypothetical protein
MSAALPGISISQATPLLQQQDQLRRSFPEVASVFCGLYVSTTDKAPLDMYDNRFSLDSLPPSINYSLYHNVAHLYSMRLQSGDMAHTRHSPGHLPGRRIFVVRHAQRPLARSQFSMLCLAQCKGSRGFHHRFFPHSAER